MFKVSTDLDEAREKLPFSNLQFLLRILHNGTGGVDQRTSEFFSPLSRKISLGLRISINPVIPWLTRT